MKMSDLISIKAMREAMYHEAMEKDSNEQKWDGGCWIRYKMFERVVESLPSAQKTGHWINRSLNILYPEWERYICSSCGKCSNNYDYCPHCGSQNRGEEE